MADTRKSNPKQKQAATGKQGRRGTPQAAGSRPEVRDADGGARGQVDLFEMRLPDTVEVWLLGEVR